MDHIQKIIKDSFGAIKWFDCEPINGLKGWALLETNPLPQKSELPMVIADICNLQPIHVDTSSGKLYHSQECSSPNHNLPHWRFKRIVETIEEKTFKVAIYPRGIGLLKLPIAIPIDPLITYDIFPDHPHINHCGEYSVGTFIPDSICYAENPRELGNNEQEILINSIKEICVWLFRHQVWLETRKQKKPGLWIGPGAPLFDGRIEIHCQRLNPHGPCFCSHGKKYAECHMVKHVMTLFKCSKKKAQQQIQYYIANKEWERKIYIPNQKCLEKMRNIFIA